MIFLYFDLRYFYHFITATVFVVVKFKKQSFVNHSEFQNFLTKDPVKIESKCSLLSLIGAFFLFVSLLS